jgi:hypothetical protein
VRVASARGKCAWQESLVVDASGWSPPPRRCAPHAPGVTHFLAALAALAVDGELASPELAIEWRGVMQWWHEHEPTQL